MTILNHFSTFYNAIKNKFAFKDDVYTKDQVYTQNDVSTKDQVYTKSEVDTELDQIKSQIVSDDHINELIDSALGGIENGTY